MSVFRILPLAVAVMMSGCASLFQTEKSAREVEITAPVQDMVPTRDRIAAALRAIGLTVEPRGRGLAVRLPGPLFQFGSSDLHISASEKIRELASVLNQSYAANRQLVVEGHTDSLGSAEYNLSLSRWRAEAVKDELIFSGVPASRIEAAWYGESRPLAPNRQPDGSDNPEGRERNRRVEVLVLEPGL